MARDYTTIPLSEVRRRDRAIEDEDWIGEFLKRAPWGTLATVYEGQPFINNNIFVYAPGADAIYLHTARIGRTRNNIESEERVCFSVSTMGRFLPAASALNFSVEYNGVVVFGKGSIITDQTEAGLVMQMLMDKYAPHLRPDKDYRVITPDELARTSVYKIAIIEWSGKKKRWK